MKKSLLARITNIRDYLNKIISKQNDNTNPSGYEDLTPDNNVENVEEYSNALVWALRNDKIKNIAITGSYGSGKSSILRTFEKQHPEYKILNISLASFCDEKLSKKTEQLVELSILQQIFYHEKHTNIPDSRFKRIRSLNRRKLILNPP